MIVLSALPKPIGLLLDYSVIDGDRGTNWLLCSDVADVRKACLLNILAVLCVTPELMAQVLGVFEVKEERIYATVGRDIADILAGLVADPALPFYQDPGKPDAIHYNVLKAVPIHLEPVFSQSQLTSYRAEGRPSLQIVVSETSFYGFAVADIDLDLRNPLEDVVSFIGHMKELHGGLTDHLKLREQIAEGPAGPFLAYTINDDTPEAA